MDTKIAKIKIEIIGGLDIDTSKSWQEVEKEVIEELIKQLTFRKESIGMATFVEKHKDIPIFSRPTNPDKFIHAKKTVQKIELVF